MSMKFAGLDKNKLDRNSEDDAKTYDKMCEAIKDVFESHGLTRRLEF